jgi:hypothetical protein
MLLLLLIFSPILLLMFRGERYEQSEEEELGDAFAKIAKYLSKTNETKTEEER